MKRRTMNKLFFILSIIGVASVVECTGAGELGGLVGSVGGVVEGLVGGLLGGSATTKSPSPTDPTQSPTDSTQNSTDSTQSPTDSTQSSTDSTPTSTDNPTCEICNINDYVFVECFNKSDICLRSSQKRTYFYPPSYPITCQLFPVLIPSHHCPPIHSYPCSPFPPYACPPVPFNPCYPFPPYACPPFPFISTSATAAPTSPSTITAASPTSTSTTTTTPTSSPTSPPDCLQFNVVDYIKQLCSDGEIKIIGDILKCIGSLVSGPVVPESDLKTLGNCLIDTGNNIINKTADNSIVCENIGTIIENIEKIVKCDDSVDIEKIIKDLGC